MKYVTATKTVNHGDPVVESGIVGVAVKQKAAASGAGAGTPQKQIAIGEKFAIISKGIVEVLNVASAVKGSPIYIVAASNALTLTAAGNVKFGMCVELPSERGGRSTHMRVDLDAKSAF
jgi:hypothetical protein